MEYRDALSAVRYWAQRAMDDSKPNSNTYRNAKDDRDSADRAMRNAR